MLMVGVDLNGERHGGDNGEAERRRRRDGDYIGRRTWRALWEGGGGEEIVIGSRKGCWERRGEGSTSFWKFWSRRG